MEKYENVPPLPKEPAREMNVENHTCPPPLPPNEQPPPPPLQTSSDAEVMDVGSGGDGQSDTPAGDTHSICRTQLLTKGSACYKSRLIIDPNNSDQSPRTARHAPSVRKFTPDLKLLKDVKIAVLHHLHGLVCSTVPSSGTVRFTMQSCKVAMGLQWTDTYLLI